MAFCAACPAAQACGEALVYWMPSPLRALHKWPAGRETAGSALHPTTGLGGHQPGQPGPLFYAIPAIKPLPNFYPSFACSPLRRASGSRSVLSLGAARPACVPHSFYSDQPGSQPACTCTTDTTTHGHFLCICRSSLPRRQSRTAPFLHGSVSGPVTPSGACRVCWKTAAARGCLAGPLLLKGVAAPVTRASCKQVPGVGFLAAAGPAQGRAAG